MEDLIAEDLKKAVKPLFIVLTLLSNEFLAQIVVQQFAARGERQRELLRMPYALGRSRKERLQQLTDCIDAIIAQPKLPIFEIGCVAERLTLNAILVDPDEMQIVRQKDVLR